MKVRTAHKNQDGPTFKSVKEFAKEIGIGVNAAYDGLGDGTIPSIRIGNRFIIPRAAIQDWLRSANGKARPAA